MKKTDKSEIKSVRFSIGHNINFGMRGEDLDVFSKNPIGNCEIEMNSDSRIKQVLIRFPIKNLDHSHRVLYLIERKDIKALFREAL